MGKENFGRYSMRENMLKKVLIRIDYDGVTDINKWIESIKSSDLIRTKFRNYNQTLLNNATFDLSKMDEIAEQRSIPLSAFKSQPIHKFSQSSFVDHNDIVIMEIANLFTIFQIDCKKYTTIDDYFDFLTTYFNRFLDFDPYIKINRIGIRKIGGDHFEQIDQVREVFESKFIIDNTAEENSIIIEREFHDKFFKIIQHKGEEIKERSLKVNYSTLFRRINESNTLQALLDIDGYIDEYVIHRNKLQFPQDFNNTLKLLNDYLFELFKKSVTLNYLANHGDEEQ